MVVKWFIFFSFTRVYFPLFMYQLGIFVFPCLCCVHEPALCLKRIPTPPHCLLCSLILPLTGSRNIIVIDILLFLPLFFKQNVKKKGKNKKKDMETDINMSERSRDGSLCAGVCACALIIPPSKSCAGVCQAGETTAGMKQMAPFGSPIIGTAGWQSRHSESCLTSLSSLSSYE